MKRHSKLAHQSLLISGLRILWASPWTLVGLIIGMCCKPFSSQISIYHGTIGCYGIGVAWILRRVPIVGGAAALTLGHTILARDRVSMLVTHPHELVHVRQYERWGPFFVPAYLLCGLWLWWISKDPYWDNPFEKEAYKLENEYKSRNIV